MVTLAKRMERKENADDDLISFLSGEVNYRMIIFDTETNGLLLPDKPIPSVLSISAMVGTLVSKDEFRQEGVYNRFYYPKEEYQPGAIKVNGLTREEVDDRRTHQGNVYPEYFLDDLEAFKDFCTGTKLFIGHNAVGFDCKLVPCIEWDKMKVFDTQATNENIVCAGWREDLGKWKWPKLREAVNFYGIKADETQYHGSKYDVEMTLKIFMEMLRRSSVRLKRF
jgi:DNA polymerase III epsilon subunit-like protein